MLLGVPVIHRITGLRSREQKKNKKQKKKTESHNEVQANEVARACGPLCMCFHLHVGVSKHIKYTVTLACVHSCVVKRKKVRHITDCCVTLSDTRCPGQRHLPLPLSCTGYDLGLEQGRQWRKCNQTRRRLTFLLHKFMYTMHLPLPPFPLHQNPFFLPLIPTHQLAHLLMCKLKATLEIFRQCSLIFWYATDSKGLFFFIW